MSILKFENRTPNNLQQMYDYLFDLKKTDIHGIFGIGLNPLTAVADMKFIQYLYRRQPLAHEYVQVILSFDEGIMLNISRARVICERIGEVLITDKRQVFGAIHYLNTDKMHCHYLINYVGTDGSLYRQNYSVHYYRDLVNEILQEYDLNPIQKLQCSDSNYYEGTESYEEI